MKSYRFGVCWAKTWVRVAAGRRPLADVLVREHEVEVREPVGLRACAPRCAVAACRSKTAPQAGLALVRAGPYCCDRPRRKWPCTMNCSTCGRHWLEVPEGVPLLLCWKAGCLAEHSKA